MTKTDAFTVIYNFTGGLQPAHESCCCYVSEWTKGAWKITKKLYSVVYTYATHGNTNST
jgi:hypothetical protein